MHVLIAFILVFVAVYAICRRPNRLAEANGWFAPEKAGVRDALLTALCLATVLALALGGFWGLIVGIVELFR